MNCDLYVDKNYDKYLNKDIYVVSTTDMLPRTFCAKFLDFKIHYNYIYLYFYIYLKLELLIYTS